MRYENSLKNVISYTPLWHKFSVYWPQVVSIMPVRMTNSDLS